ncbi:MAG: hypothetical protein D6B27_08705 [Gammaproteobacteria bacterium]|nr:MAG: hypothetical protein D6B27_08705 [Gammaproteobacteria bacterium]
MIYKIIITSVILIVSFCCNAGENLIFNGFATLGMEYTDPATEIGNTNRDSNFSFSDLTRLGLQTTWLATDKLSFTGQIITKGRKDFDVDLSWAFAKYNFNKYYSIRIGRQQIPIYILADFQHVGYTYPWPQPPREVYWQLPFSDFDAISNIVNLNFGEWDLTTQIAYGKTESEAGTINGKHELDLSAYGINAELTNRKLRLGASYFKSSLSTDLTGIYRNQAELLIASEPLAGIYLNQISQDTIDGWFKVDNADCSFKSIGATYDNNNLLIIGEFTQRRVEELYPDTDGWYFTLGYRFNNIMPYLSFGKIHTKNYENKHLHADGLIEETVINYITSEMERVLIVNQKETAIGVRYDVTEYAAVKAQYKKVDTYGQIGTFGNIPASNTIDYFTLAIDLVY